VLPFSPGNIFCVLCLIVVPLPPGKTPFAVKISNKNINDIKNLLVIEIQLQKENAVIEELNCNL
jgi:hypothetical protein